MRKFERQGVILRLVSEQELSTQTELADALRAAGFDAVQTTVSRDVDSTFQFGITSPGGSRVVTSPTSSGTRPG